MSEGKWASQDPQSFPNSSLIHPPSEGDTGVVSLTVVSSDRRYYEKIKEMYNSRPSGEGQVVAVHLESHDRGIFHRPSDEEKAMADITLLALSRHLFISASSAFGALAQGLHGSPATVLNIRDGEWQHNGRPLCEKSTSANACLGIKPLALQCPGESPHAFEDCATWIPPVRQCPDWPSGIVLLPDSAMGH